MACAAVPPAYAGSSDLPTRQKRGLSIAPSLAVREPRGLRLLADSGKAPRVRADTFGYIQRCWPEPSPVDTAEARAVGKYAAELAAKGDASASVIIVRTSNAPDAYRSECACAELPKVARRTRHVSAEFIAGTNDVSATFNAYCRPLVGTLPKFERL